MNTRLLSRFLTVRNLVPLTPGPLGTFRGAVSGIRSHMKVKAGYALWRALALPDCGTEAAFSPFTRGLKLERLCFSHIKKKKEKGATLIYGTAGCHNELSYIATCKLWGHTQLRMLWDSEEERKVLRGQWQSFLARDGHRLGLGWALMKSNKRTPKSQWPTEQKWMLAESVSNFGHFSDYSLFGSLAMTGCFM